MLPHRRRKDQELARKHAERRHAKDRERAEHQAPSNRRANSDQTANSIHLLCSRGLRRVTGSEEDGGLCEGVNRHVQQGGEICDGTAQAERKGYDAHVLDR